MIDSDILTKFEVGELTTQEYPSYPPMSPFYRTLKQRVATYMTETKQDAQFSQVSVPPVLLSPGRASPRAFVRMMPKLAQTDGGGTGGGDDAWAGGGACRSGASSRCAWRSSSA